MVTLLEGVLAVYSQGGVFKCEGVNTPKSVDKTLTLLYLWAEFSFVCGNNQSMLCTKIMFCLRLNLSCTYFINLGMC